MSSSPDALSPPTLSVDLLRADDLLALRFDLVNLTMQTGAGQAPSLSRAHAGQPAFLVVNFPPQHIAEEAFPLVDGAIQNLANPPVPAVLAGPTRLVFKIPDATATIPFTLEALLDWSSFEPQLTPNALPFDAPTGTGIVPRQPGPLETGIELPYRLVLSPDASGGWAHRADVADHGGRIELWHTRLGARAGGSVDESRVPTFRAVWTPDLDAPAAVDPFAPGSGTLTASNRSTFVRLSSDFSIDNNPPIPPFPPVEPLAVSQPAIIAEPQPSGLSPIPVPADPFNYPVPLQLRRLMLSSLGGWLDTRGPWEFPPIEIVPRPPTGIVPIEWRHIASMGRDQYVRVDRPGFLAPFGHAASFITVSERRFHTGPANTGQVAYLLQRDYIVVKEPEKDFDAVASAFPSGGREMPLKRVRLTTLVTPDLDPPPVVLPSHPFPPFFPTINGADFLFHLVASDSDGQTVDFTMPLLFVSDDDPLSILTLLADDSSADRRRAPLRGQSLAFAPNDPAKPGATSLKTNALTVLVEAAAGDLPPAWPRFLPTVVAAEVSIPAIDRLLGSSGTSGATTISYHSGYLQNGFDPAANKGQAFASLVNGLPMAFPADRSGGLAKPNMNINGLSRVIGPVSGVDDIALGNFKPKDVFNLAGANLLGVIKLSDLLDDITGGLDPGQFDVGSLAPPDLDAKLADPAFRIPVPLMTTRPIFPPGSNPSTTLPMAVETKMLWRPQLTQSPPAVLLTDRNDSAHLSNTALTLRSTIKTRLADGGSTSLILGTLERFGLNFVDIVQVRFKSLSFRAETGKKMDVSADGLDIQFSGVLQFVNTLRDILPPDGFSDPPSLDVRPDGITAGYTLGVPSVGVGVLILENIALSASLSLPFVDKPAAVRFAISERQHPFLVTVSLFGGGGFFAISASTKGIQQVEASIEFGGNFEIDLVVASGGVHLLAGIYFNLVQQTEPTTNVVVSDVKLTGYLRCGGFVEVLEIVTVSVEFYMGLTYNSLRNSVTGRASVTVAVKVLFFSQSVSLSVEKEFAGPGGSAQLAALAIASDAARPASTFDQLVAPADWATYCAAFA